MVLHARPLIIVLTALVAAAFSAGCADARPDAKGLRESFAQQLAANSAVKNFHRNGDEFTFLGPDRNGGQVTWRVKIDSAYVEAAGEDRTPPKGIVKSSWHANERIVLPSSDGQRSNLPQALLANGLAQECWAFWNSSEKRWGWE